MDADEQGVLETTLRRFAGRLEAVLLIGEEPDGDLGRLPELLAQAREMGLLADPVAGEPGYELGVWGQSSRQEGAARSLLALSILGQACAGFAIAVHAQGLACLALGEATGLAPATPLAAALMPLYGIPLSAWLGAEGSGLWLEAGRDTLTLRGASPFLLAAAPPGKLICFALRSEQAQEAAEWVELILDPSAPGVALAEVTDRTGLRAARQYSLHCDPVRVDGSDIVCVGEPARRALSQVLACDWLGQAAIALGVVRRALQDSRNYTAQRYQGGRIIQAHAGVQLLQGTAEYDSALLEAILRRHADEPLDALESRSLLGWAVSARLAVVEHAHRAVSYCLQTLGGYGYMEDFDLAKRLRDMSALKSLHGAPDQLKLFLNELRQTA